ncbi:MAG: insulinase family protein [Planctomycetales bacterium]|nr:insulinase family protein [Planctomycetales bacterium]
MRRSLVLGMAVIFGALARPGEAQENKVGEMKRAGTVPTLLRTTPNGVTVVVKEMRSSPAVCTYVFVRNTGSLYEGEFLGCGISHYYEHLVAGGTTWNRPESKSRDMLFQIGNQSNAYTYKDHTAYYITTASPYFDVALDLLSDWVPNCALWPAEVKREKDVILKEIEKGEDEPDRVIHQLFSETMFRVHPTRLPIIGYKPVFLAVSSEDIAAFYKLRYVPDNFIVVVVGDVDREEAYTKIEKAFAPVPRRPVIAPSLPEEPAQIAPRWAEKEMGGTKVAYTHVGWRTVGLTHPDLYPLDLLDFILGQGDSSRLVRRLRDQERLVLTVNTGSATPGYGCGYFTVQMSGEPEKARRAVEVVREEIARILADPPTDEEIAKAKIQKASDYVFQTEKAENRAREIGWNILGTGDPDFGERYVEGIQRVTREDVLRVVRTYFHPQTETVAIVRPEGSAPVAGEGAAAGTAGSAGLVAEKIALPNGLRLLARPSRASPMIAIQAWMLGGVLAETPETNGIAKLTTEMLLRGTKTKTADEIARAVDGMGGSIRVTTGNNALGVSLSVLAGDLEKGLALMADVLRNPSFNPKEFDTLRDRTLKAIRQEDDNWQAEAVNFWRRKFFTRHPYRLTPLGRQESVEKFKPADLRAFHARFVVPQNLVVAVYGDVGADGADGVARTRAAVERQFGSMPAAPGFKFPDLEPESPRPPGEVRVEKPSGKKLVVIVIGYPGVPLPDEDRYALDVIDAVTSGIYMPGGWFHEKLRGEKEGLVYVVHGINWLGVGTGSFYVFAATSPDKQDRVLQLMREQFEKIQGDAMTDAELDSAKKVCVTSKLLQREANGDQAMEASLDELYGLGYRFGERYAERINAVTKADVKRVANRLFGQGSVLAMTVPGPSGSR